MELAAKPHHLRDLAESLSKAARAIDQEVRALDAASERFTQGWQGEARLAYTRELTRFVSRSQAQLHALRQATAALEELAEEYSSADDRSAICIPARILT